MLQNAYFLAKIGADTAENERNSAEILPKIGNYPTDPLPYAASSPGPQAPPASPTAGAAAAEEPAAAAMEEEPAAPATEEPAAAATEPAASAPAADAMDEGGEAEFQ